MRWPWRRSRPDSGSAAPHAVAAVVAGEPGRAPTHAADDGRGLGHEPTHADDGGELRLVKVAYAANLPEAELIQGLLRGERIPSMVRRNGGFDVPDFIAAGPRDILVPAAHAERARELLA